nr:DUF1638 domain-containing protein [Moorella sulfitireducens]
MAAEIQIPPARGTRLYRHFAGTGAKRTIQPGSTHFLPDVGLLRHWKEIFAENLGWDKTEAHLNFGRYERILFLDSGISTVDEEKLLEFFDYTGVPIEIRPLGLNHFTNLIQKLIQYQ